MTTQILERGAEAETTAFAGGGDGFDQPILVETTEAEHFDGNNERAPGFWRFAAQTCFGLWTHSDSAPGAEQFYSRRNDPNPTFADPIYGHRG